MIEYALRATYAVARTNYANAVAIAAPHRLTALAAVGSLRYRAPAP